MIYRPIKKDPEDPRLARFLPDDWKHYEKYPFSTVAPKTVSEVNKILRLPTWHWDHDQGREGACVGFGASMMMSILNRKRYEPRWLWNEAKKIDEWPETNPGDDQGTSVRAAADVLRDQGHIILRYQNRGPLLAEGITANRWAYSVDEMRTALSMGIPVTIGVNWYANFDNPVYKSGYYWVGLGDLGNIRGGHAVCIYGASDRRQAFRVKNSWGRYYPLIWLPYGTMERLLKEWGEATLVTDR